MCWGSLLYSALVQQSNFYISETNKEKRGKKGFSFGKIKAIIKYGIKIDREREREKKQRLNI